MFVIGLLHLPSGRGISCAVQDGMLEVSWSGVFEWESKHGSLLYEVFIGSKYGMADILKAHMTEHSTITVPTEFIEDVCFVAINGIAPSGFYETTSQLIHL